MISENSIHPVPHCHLRRCLSDTVVKAMDSVGQSSSVCSPVGKVRCVPRGCQRFCQVGARLQLKFKGILFPESSVPCCRCRRSTNLSAAVACWYDICCWRDRSSSTLVEKVLNCTSSKCWWPIGAQRILISSLAHESLGSIGVCNVAKLCCGEEFGRNINDSAGFKRRRIVSMMVANVSTLGRT